MIPPRPFRPAAPPFSLGSGNLNPHVASEPSTQTSFRSTYVPTHPDIHKTYFDLIGQPYNDAAAPVIGYDADVPSSVYDMARFLGVKTDQPTMLDRMPITQEEHGGGWPLEPGQTGYIDPRALQTLLRNSPSNPSLAFMYTDPTVKGTESYIAGPSEIPSNGEYIPNDYTSLILNLNPTADIGYALHSYAHNWESALEKYRPEVYQMMKSTVGDVHGPYNRKGEYEYGDEGQYDYLKRWLSTAANYVSPQENQPSFVGGDNSYDYIPATEEPLPPPLPENVAQTEDDMMYS